MTATITAPESTATSFVKIVAPRGAWLAALNACAVTKSTHLDYRIVTLSCDEAGAVRLSTIMAKGCTGRASTTASIPEATCSGSGNVEAHFEHRALVAAVRAAAPSRKKEHDALDIELTLTEGRAILTVGGQPCGVVSEEKRGLPALDPAPEVAMVKTKQLRAAVAAVKTSAAADDYTPAFESLGMTSDGTTLELLATDRYRLARATVAAPGQPFTALPKCKSVASALTHLKGETTSIGADDTGKLTLTSGSVTFTFEQYSDNTWPKLHHLLSGFGDTWIDLDRASLLSATEFVRTTVNTMGRNDGAAVLRLTSTGAATLHADYDGDTLGLGRDLVAGECEGIAAAELYESHRKQALLLFNPNYLHDAMKSLTTKTVRLYFNRPTKCVLFTEGTHDDDKPSIVLQPMRRRSI